MLTPSASPHHVQSRLIGRCKQAGAVERDLRTGDVTQRLTASSPSPPPRKGGRVDRHVHRVVGHAVDGDAHAQRLAARVVKLSRSGFFVNVGHDEAPTPPDRVYRCCRQFS